VLRDARRVLLIDAANVVGSRPTGWWRDRAGAARELTARVRRAVADGTLSPPVVLVLEGQARNGVDAGVVDGVEVVHAAGHGDDMIVTLAAQSDQPVVLVSADRELAERVGRSGADVVGPTWLLDRLPP
jgi:hypothetical protein